MSGPGETESLAEAAGARGELTRRRTGIQAAVEGHLRLPGDRFQGANQHAACAAFDFARDIGAEVAAVDGVDVGVAGRSEENRVPWGETTMGVGGGVGWCIVRAQIRFDFNDAASQDAGAGAMDEQFPKQPWGGQLRRHLKKGASKLMAGHGLG